MSRRPIDPIIVKSIRSQRFNHPNRTDAVIANDNFVSVSTVRRYTDDIFTNRRHVLRVVNMRNGNTYSF